MRIKLNLIPPSKKEEIALARRLRLVGRVEIILTVILIGFLAMFGSFKYILRLDLSSNLATQKEDEKAFQYDKIKNYDDQFKEINSKLAQLSSAKDDQLYWSKLFIKLSQQNSSAISLGEINTIDYKIILKGIAGNRDDLISFKGKLEKEECFSDVNLPLSDLVSKDNIDFEINFNFREDCLKNK